MGSILNNPPSPGRLFFFFFFFFSIPRCFTLYELKRERKSICLTNFAFFSRSSIYTPTVTLTFGLNILFKIWQTWVTLACFHWDVSEECVRRCFSLSSSPLCLLSVTRGDDKTRSATLLMNSSVNKSELQTEYTQTFSWTIFHPLGVCVLHAAVWLLPVYRLEWILPSLLPFMSYFSLDVAFFSLGCLWDRDLFSQWV